MSTDAVPTSSSTVAAQADASSRRERLARALDELFGEDSLTIHFQPIVDVTRAGIMGFEALCRGPSDSPLHSPMVMFEVAAEFGRLVELERRVVRLVLRRFFELALPGAVFVNVSADTLAAAADRAESLHSEISSLGVPATRVVIELTETRPTLEFESLKRAARAFRKLGFRIALDDLGEGFASLKRWLDMRPDFVKIDRHFVDGVAGDPVKQQLIRSILDVARAGGAEVVAEGIEEEPDLRVLRHIGVRLCQGYLLARPHPSPRADLRIDIERMLVGGSDLGGDQIAGRITAAMLARPSECVTAEVTCAMVLDMFSVDEGLRAIAVIDGDGRPIGILRLLTVLKRGAGRFFRDLHGRKSCTWLMDTDPLVFDERVSLQAMSEALSRVDDHHMVDGFLVTRDGRHIGSGRISDLVKAAADAKLASALEANPLTLLPGNVPIRSRLEAMLASGRTFTVVYWDINDFKPFNDIYGYSAGDRLIRGLAGQLKRMSDATDTFLGHVGGDDFVAILECEEWEMRVSAVLEAFDADLVAHLRPEHLRARGYHAANRRNEEAWHPLPSLAAGVLPVEPGVFSSVHEVSAVLAELKAQAKKRGGSAWFCERRARRGEGS